MSLQAALAFLADEPMIEDVDLLISDLNGILRGKRVPVAGLDKVFSDGMRFPVSTLGMDIAGEDVLDNGLVWETGDGDGLCLPVEGGLALVPWGDKPRAQLLTSMWYRDGRPFMGDGRQVLASLVRRIEALGYTPVVATELEFYLMDGDAVAAERAMPPSGPLSRQSLAVPRVYSADLLDEFETVLAAMVDACNTQEIPADTILAENGPGQFEINLKHVPDVLLAADHAVLFKRAIRKVARRHGLHASFMAKPYGESAGSGLHVHMSLLETATGKNVFDDGSEQGSDLLRQAVGGVLAALPESMLIFAPHLNSFRRFQAAAHCPNTASWGYENRSVAVRIPDAPGIGRRFEHRMAGADANPYLALSAILAGVLYGLENKLVPPAPETGEASGGVPLPLDWTAAIKAFETGSILREGCSSEFHRAFAALKRQESAVMARRVSDVEYAAYLGIL